MVANWPSRRGSDRDIERRTQQIKEIIRLGSAMRAETGLENILVQVVEAISTTLGFSVAVLNLVNDIDDRVDIAASVGLTNAEHERLRQSPPLLSRLLAVMRDDFRISQSYFVSHNYKHLLEGMESVVVFSQTPPSAQRAPDAWHPEDFLFVPLYSPRGNKLIGILSLDQPEDNKVPSLETIEVVELFAGQAALAIDSSRLFQEREQERKGLEAQLFELLYYMEQVRQGSLDVRVHLSGTMLRPMADSLDAVLQTFNGLLADVRTASEVVNERATGVREEAGYLASATYSQAQQIFEVSRSVETMAQSVRSIADIAHGATAVARDAIEVSQKGREAAERAAQGMIGVREMAIQSVKKMKRLGESSQEIGDIVQVIADFASQTNLLALNATIEASRAGEHGRGFAIVAQEIRNLAVSSAEATKEIHARIKGIQNETNSVVVAIEHSTQHIVEQSELASQAGAALTEVDGVTQRIAQAITSMNETATRQAEAATVMAGSVANIAQITAETRDSVEQMRGAMDQLVELAQSLLDAIGVFRLREHGQASGPALLSAAAQASGTPTYEQATQPMSALGMPPVLTPGNPGASGSQYPLPQQPYAERYSGVHEPVTKGTPTRALPRSNAPLHPGQGPTTSGELPPLPGAANLSGPLPPLSRQGYQGVPSGPLPQAAGAPPYGAGYGAGNAAGNASGSNNPGLAPGLYSVGSAGISGRLTSGQLGTRTSGTLPPLGAHGPMPPTSGQLVGTSGPLPTRPYPAQRPRQPEQTPPPQPSSQYPAPSYPAPNYPAPQYPLEQRTPAGPGTADGAVRPRSQTRVLPQSERDDIGQ